MGRYSSDSDSSSRGDSRRSRNSALKSKRSRSSSSSSSTSRSYQKKSYKHKHSRARRSRSRSKNRHDKSKHLHSDSSGRTHGTNKSKNRKARSKVSRSKSRERGVRSRSKERSWKSRSRSNSKQRSPSRTKDRKRRSKSSTPEKSRSRDSPDSRTGSGSVKEGPSTEEQLRAKLQKAIKAAQSADDQLRQQGLLSSGTSSSVRKEEMLKASVTPESCAPEPLESILNEINDSSFVPKHFTSSKSTSQVLLEQPSTDLALIPDTNIKLLGVLEEPTRIFHSNLFLDPEQKLDKWIKKLFHLRQKAINGEPII